MRQEFIKFQFYLSSIKSGTYLRRNFQKYCFNSTLVQLKAASGAFNASFTVRFNSTLVQLKGSILTIGKDW